MIIKGIFNDVSPQSLNDCDAVRIPRAFAALMEFY